MPYIHIMNEILLYQPLCPETEYSTRISDNQIRQKSMSAVLNPLCTMYNSRRISE